MDMKNKLRKHHKRKSSFVFRNLVFALLGFGGVGAVVAIPTYIVANNVTEISAFAAGDQEDTETSESELDTTELNELLSLLNSSL